MRPSLVYFHIKYLSNLQEVMMACPRKQQAGFTLTELMVTVIVIGILAAVAVPSYTRYIRNVKMQEARTMLPQIAMKEKAYYLEFRNYLTTTQRNPTAMPCGGSQQTWLATDAEWNALGFRPATPGTYFQYFVHANDNKTTLPSCVGAINTGLHYPTATRGDWFIACAYGNLVGNSCGSQATSNKSFLSFGISGSERFGGRVFGNPNTK